MSFRLFDHLNKAILEAETKKARAARTPSVWPSEASAIRLDPTVGSIVGKCHRASLLRIIGTPVTNTVDPLGAWRWVIGRMIEDHVTHLSRTGSIFVAAGVRTFVEDLYLPLEMDIIVMDPVTKQGCIVECKTFYGHYATKEIVKQNKPKIENLMQISMYLLEISTGKRLKEIIQKGLADKAASAAAGTVSRNRIVVNEELLAQMSDGPLMAKLIYLARDEGHQKEFDVTVEEDLDGSHYPAVDGSMWKIFTIDSIYDRYRTLQNYWFNMRREALKRLLAKGAKKPDHVHLILSYGDHYTQPDDLTAEQEAAEEAFFTALEREMRLLPNTFWPPAEYQWAYTPEKIEKLYALGHLSKVKYNDWKKKKAGKDRVGDWQCLYCDYKKMCVPLQNPNWAYLLADIDKMSLVEDEAEE